MKLTYDNIKLKKNNLNYPSELFINGKYTKSNNEKFFDNISPIDGKIINKVFFAQNEDIDLAVSTAREVFNKIVDGAWRNGEPGMIFLDQVNKDNHVT